tara:strand:- start:1629 stop:3326 length:1698 start_codon:yes stop_codon:yes gene_type:complete
MNMIRVLVAIIGLSLMAVSATAAEGVRVWQNSAGAGFTQFYAAMKENGHANDQAISTNALGLVAFTFAQGNGHLERVPEANRNPQSYAALFRRWNGLSSEVISVAQFRAKGAGNGFWLPILDSPAAAPDTELAGDIEAITASIEAMAERLAAVESKDLTTADIFGLEREFSELRDSIPDIGPLQGSVAELTRFMTALKSGDMSQIEALQGNLVVAVETSFNERMAAFEGILTAVDARIDAEAETRAAADTKLADALAELARLSATAEALEAETAARTAGDEAVKRQVAGLTAEGGAITLLRAAVENLTGEEGQLASIWTELDLLTKDGGRLAVIEGQLTAVDSQGIKLDDLTEKVGPLVEWFAANQAAFDALIGEEGRVTTLEGQVGQLVAALETLTKDGGRLALLEKSVSDEAIARVEGDKALQTYGIWGGVALLLLLGFGLAFSGYRRGDRINLLGKRVKKLEKLELADLEWHDANVDLATLEPGLENAVVWRVRQVGTEDWCAVKIGREADTPAGKVFTDLPTEVGGEASDQLFSIEELSRLDILLALKEKRLVPGTLSEAA